jgi:hypothetical protein
VHDYLAGQQHALDGIAQLDLECAASMAHRLAAPENGAAVRTLDITA